MNIETMIVEIDKLDDEIFALNQTIADKVNALQTKRRESKAELDLAIAKEASVDLKDKDYGCGTANIETERHKIKVTVSKSVKWDEKQLHVIRQQIIDAGKKPTDFIKEKLSVSETAYKGFSPEIQRTFESAREVSASAPKIEIVRK